MTEQDIRVDMLPKWKAAQAAFIDLCGGDMLAMQRREADRQRLERPLVLEYLARVAALPKDG